MQPSEVTIEGTVRGLNKSKLILREAADNTLFAIDSTLTDQDGNFTFTLPINTPTFILVQAQGVLEPLILLVEPGDRVRVNSQVEAFATSYTVSGSQGSLLVRNLNLKMHQTVAAIDSLARVFRAMRGEPGFDTLKKSIDSTYNIIVANHRKSTRDFISAHRYSLASILALYQGYDSERKVLNNRDDFHLFQLVDSSLYPLYPNNRLVVNLHENVRKMSRQLELQDMRVAMLQENDVISIAGWPSFHGGEVTLMGLGARYILIDFWASWCNQCIPNNLKLRELHREYSPKGFQVLQVSLDAKTEELGRVIERDSLNWVHVMDGKVWDSPIIEAMRISSIPSNYLIDRYGRIIARNLTPQELRIKLMGLLP